MKFKLMICGGFIAGFVLAVSSLSPIISRAEEDTKALFEAKCSVCHSVDKPKSKKKSKEEWQSTVLRMKAKPKASISDEEAAKIIDYLATHCGR